MTNTQALPADLRETGLFCCWRYEERDGRWTKVPFNPRTGGKAQSDNPATFAPLAVAEAAQGSYDGMGVGIFERLAAIDIDHCITGSIWSDMAIDVYEIMDGCYTETSPSGEGLRLLFSVSPGFQYDTGRYYINNQKAGLEVYVAGVTKKYVTVTGNALNDCHRLLPRDSQLLQVLEKYMVRPQQESGALPWDGVIGGGQPLDLSDQELLEKARSAKNGAAFSLLWAGDTGAYRGDDSAADMALCNQLAFWTGRDPERMDRLFRQSGLMRDKWDRRQSGTTYGRITIEKACQSCREVYSPRETPQQAFQPVGNPQAETVKPMLIKASDVPYEPPRWLIAPYIQKGKGTLIQADNGTGKTAFVCAIASHVTTGRPLLGIPVATPGNVLILSVEDDLPVLRGRIEASGGDLDKCHFLTNAAGLSFNSPEVEAAVKQIEAKLVIFDPLQAFMGAKVDMFRANETRPEFAKLFEMCARNDCACIIIAHTSKTAGEKSPVNRALGSVDIPAAMRSVLQIIKNPDNEYERIAVHVKCSNAPKGQSLVYSIGDRGGVQWVGFSPMTDDDLTTIVKRKEKGIPYENEPLVQVFNQLITDKPGGGFWSYADLKSEGAKILGFPPYSDITDLRNKLSGPLSKELQQRDGLIVTCGVKGAHGVRGIRIEQYQLPQGYQTSL